MTRTLLVFSLLAGLHLALVIGGAFNRKFLPEGHPAESVLRTYGAASGADSSYSFFAPGVGSHLRATFVLSDNEGNTWTDDLHQGVNNEAGLRVGGSVTIFDLPGTKSAIRTALLNTWAAYMLDRHPCAERVVIHIEVFDPLTMSEVQQGQTPQWKQVEKYGPFHRSDEPFLASGK